VYSNHVEGVKLQLAREPLPLPRLRLAARPTLELGYDDVVLEGYQHHAFIKFPVAV
jgi:thymidylate synthase